jgi:hypothetical protein
MVNFQCFSMDNDCRQKLRTSWRRWNGDIYNVQANLGPQPKDGDCLFVLFELHFPDLFHPVEHILYEAVAPWCDVKYKERETAFNEEDWTFSSELGDGHAIHRFPSFEKTLSFFATHCFAMFDPTFLTWRGGGPYTLKGYERMPMFLGNEGTIWALTAFTINSVYPVLERNADDMDLMKSVVEDNYKGNLPYCRNWRPIHNFNSAMTLPDKQHDSEACFFTHLHLENILLWYYSPCTPFTVDDEDIEFEFKWGMRWREFEREQNYNKHMEESSIYF